MTQGKDQKGELAILAIVGRPNVGKSTLFNRLAGSRLAIVADEPGTTRDRLTTRMQWGDRHFIIVDTGGLEVAPTSELVRQVKAQVEVAIRDADALLFLVDVLQGVAPADLEVAERLRRVEKPVILAVNKVDNPRWALEAQEFYHLGLGEPVLISAYHNHGVDDLMAEVIQRLPPSEAPQEEPEAMRLAIIGRPNVGKSMLLNAVLGEERAIVSEAPGTTRDAIDTIIEYQDQSMVLIDTAGVRRRGSIQTGVEKFSVLRALRAIERADVALLLVDAMEAGIAQDQHLAGYLMDAFTGVVVVANKWDLAEEAGVDPAEFRRQLRARLKFLPYVPVRFTSALKGEGIEGVLDAALEVYRERRKEVPAEVLHNVMMEALAKHPPPTAKGRSVHIGQVRQEGINPPTFSFRVNRPELVHFSYRRYLENRLRAAFGFRGSHLKLVFKKRGRR